MKKLSALLGVCVLCVSTVIANPVGMIEYLEGDVSIIRKGENPVEADFGSDIENQDVVKTGVDGNCVIAMDASSGMGGTVTVTPRSIFAVGMTQESGQPSSEVALMAGAVAVKVKRLTGTPSFAVRSSSTVMGVRGTEFTVDVSVNGSILVACNEGRVACTGSEGDTMDAVPGQVIEQRVGERLRRVPVAVSSLQKFRDNWGGEEIEAFKASPVRVLDQYAKAYLRHKADLEKAFEPLLNDAGLAVWIDQDRKGQAPHANDVTVMRQKSTLAPKLMRMKGILFFFEPVYYRLDEVRNILGGMYANQPLSSGQTVGAFLRQMQTDFRGLERKTALFRYALRLYSERNEGREPISLDSEGGDFFDDTDSFFD
jgi:hypothetical protein